MKDFDIIHAAHLFDISSSHCSKVINTWIFILYNAFKSLLVWPSQFMVRSNLPKSFKLYPKTRVIIDCTEFYAQKPFRPLAQRATRSNYKHANTFKIINCKMCHFVTLQSVVTCLFTKNNFTTWDWCVTGVQNGTIRSGYMRRWRILQPVRGADNRGIIVPTKTSCVHTGHSDTGIFGIILIVICSVFMVLCHFIYVFKIFMSVHFYWHWGIVIIWAGILRQYYFTNR